MLHSVYSTFSDISCASRMCSRIGGAGIIVCRFMLHEWALIFVVLEGIGLRQCLWHPIHLSLPNRSSSNRPDDQDSFCYTFGEANDADADACTMRQPVDDRHIPSKMVGRKETLEVRLVLLQCFICLNHSSSTVQKFNSMFDPRYSAMESQIMYKLGSPVQKVTGRILVESFLMKDSLLPS